jgi:nucleoside diphosphate kinase
VPGLNGQLPRPCRATGWGFATPDACRVQFAHVPDAPASGAEVDEDDLLDLLDDDDDNGGISFSNVTGTGPKIGSVTLASPDDFDFDVDQALEQSRRELDASIESAVREARGLSPMGEGLEPHEGESGSDYHSRVSMEMQARSASLQARRREVFDRVAKSLGASSHDTAQAAHEAREELGLEEPMETRSDVPSVGGTATAGGRRVLLEPEGSKYWSSTRALERRAGVAPADSTPATDESLAAEDDSDSFEADSEGGQLAEAERLLEALPGGAALRGSTLGQQVLIAAKMADSASQEAREARRRQGEELASGDALLDMDPALEALLGDASVPAATPSVPSTPLGEVLAMLDRLSGDEPTIERPELKCLPDPDAAELQVVPSRPEARPETSSQGESDDESEMSDSEWEARLEAAAARRAEEATDAAGSEPTSKQDNEADDAIVPVCPTRTFPLRQTEDADAAVISTRPLEPPAPPQHHEEAREPELQVPPAAAAKPVIAPPAIPSRQAQAHALAARRAAAAYENGPVSLTLWHHTVATAGWCPSLGAVPSEAAMRTMTGVSVALDGTLDDGNALSVLAGLLSLAWNSDVRAVGGAIVEGETLPGKLQRSGRAFALLVSRPAGAPSAKQILTQLSGVVSAETVGLVEERMVVEAGDAIEPLARQLFGPFAFEIRRQPSSAVGLESGSWGLAAAGVGGGSFGVAVAFPGQGIAPSEPDVSLAESRRLVKHLSLSLSAFCSQGLSLCGLRLAWPGGAHGSLLTDSSGWHDRSILSDEHDGEVLPSIVVLVRGPDVCKGLAEAMGAANLRAAAASQASSIRGALGVRGFEISRSEEAASREASFWFGGRLALEERERGDCSGANAPPSAVLHPSESGSDSQWTGWPGLTSKSERLHLVQLPPPSVCSLKVPGGATALERTPGQSRLVRVLRLLGEARLGVVGLHGDPVRGWTVVAHGESALARTRAALRGEEGFVIYGGLLEHDGDEDCVGEAEARGVGKRVRALWDSCNGEKAVEFTPPKGDDVKVSLSGCEMEDMCAQGVSLVFLTADALCPGGESLEAAVPGAISPVEATDPATAAAAAVSTGPTTPAHSPPWFSAHCPRRDTVLGSALARLLFGSQEAGARPRGWAAFHGTFEAEDLRGGSQEGMPLVLFGARSFPGGLPVDLARAAIDSAKLFDLSSLVGDDSSVRMPPAKWRAIMQWYLSSRPAIVLAVGGMGAASLTASRVGPLSWSEVRQARSFASQAARTARADHHGSSALARASASVRAEFAVDPIRCGAFGVSAETATATLLPQVFGLRWAETMSDAIREHAADLAEWPLRMLPRLPKTVGPSAVVSLMLPPPLNSWSFSVVLVKAARDHRSGLFSKVLRALTRHGLTVRAIRQFVLSAVQARAFADSHVWSVQQCLADVGISLSAEAAGTLERGCIDTLATDASVAVLVEGPQACARALRITGPPLFAASDSGASSTVRSMVNDEWIRSKQTEGGAEFASSRTAQWMEKVKRSYDEASTPLHGRMGLRALFGSSCVHDAVQASPHWEAASEELGAAFPELVQEFSLKGLGAFHGEVADAAIVSEAETIEPGPDARSVVFLPPTIVAPAVNPDKHGGYSHSNVTISRSRSTGKVSSIETAQVNWRAPDHAAWSIAASKLPTILDALVRDRFTIKGMRMARLDREEASALVKALAADGVSCAPLSVEALTAGQSLSVVVSRTGAVERLAAATASRQFDPSARSDKALVGTKLQEILPGIAACPRTKTGVEELLSVLFKLTTPAEDDSVAGGGSLGETECKEDQ